MRRLAEVAAELGWAGEAEVLEWVEAACVRPEPGADPGFLAIDVARLRLIRELAEELALDRETIPLVMELVDQVYDLRRRLRAVADAVAEEPEESRRRILLRCRHSLTTGEPVGRTSRQ